MLELEDVAKPVLELEDVAKPVLDDDEVLVRVHAASTNAADWHILRGNPYIARLQLGLRKLKASILGCDLAGQIEAVGNLDRSSGSSGSHGARS